MKIGQDEKEFIIGMVAVVIMSIVFVAIKAM